MAVTNAVIRARDLRKRFGSFEAVAGIDFDVHRGECFGFPSRVWVLPAPGGLVQLKAIGRRPASSLMNSTSATSVCCLLPNLTIPC